MRRSIGVSSLLAALFSLALAVSPVRADDGTCRDATGEPAPCAAVAPVYAPPPAPPAPSTDGHSHREREEGYVDFYPFVDLVDLSGVTFGPDAPGSVPDVERGAHLEGFGHDFDRVVGGLTLGLGYRPVPWLRLPDARFSFGYGDFSGSTLALVGGAQSLTAAIHDCWMVRAQVGAGVDLDLDPVRLYALAHVSVAGYFVGADVAGSSIGGLGSDTFSTVSLEAGWTAGMEIELDPDIAYTFGYRHVHTGVEQNTFFFGVNVRLR